MTIEDKEYNLADIFFIASRIERDGRDFYHALADHFRDGQVKKLFTFLAEQEKEHYEIFQGLFKKLQKLIADAESHVFMELPQLLAIANSHKFMQVDVKKLLKETRAFSAIIDFALSCEDDSVRFFSLLKKIAGEHFEEVLNALIEEEEKHRALLLDLRRAKIVEEARPKHA